MLIVDLDFKHPNQEMEQIHEQHLKFLKKYYENKTFMTSGPKLSANGGIIVAGNISRARLEEILKEDPYYQNGFMEFRIIEFSSTLVSSDIGVFFQEEIV
ncbi:YciI family protein [Falsibacillus albus]|uniref:GTP cyclohydrolase n=1 Tax=Falsibacillus albus TaxID=2478915 RepID=A0A3L7JST2_9BACI|nr:YciI family protein [Falsibacillus albus]RLQ93325.1 GTP cyclohydrolase [Falsibacillus albus]